MSPAVNGSSEIQHFECADEIEIHNRIMFVFYVGLQYTSLPFESCCMKFSPKGIACISPKFATVKISHYTVQYYRTHGHTQSFSPLPLPDASPRQWNTMPTNMCCMLLCFYSNPLTKLFGTGLRSKSRIKQCPRKNILRTENCKGNRKLAIEFRTLLCYQKSRLPMSHNWKCDQVSTM